VVWNAAPPSNRSRRANSSSVVGASSCAPVMSRFGRVLLDDHHAVERAHRERAEKHRVGERRHHGGGAHA
jgi:hypothetical protein